MTHSLFTLAVAWLNGSVVVFQINEVALHRAQLVLGWVTISGLNSCYGKI